MDTSKEDEWNSLTSIKDIFPIYGTGIKTNRDNFVIDLDKSALMNRMNDFFDINISDSEIIGKYGLKENYVWKIPKARTKFRNNEYLIFLQENKPPKQTRLKTKPSASALRPS